MNHDKELDHIEFADGSMKMISTEASVYLAAHFKTN